MSTEDRKSRGVANRRRRHRLGMRDGFKCAYCGVESGLTIDHIVPRSKGGSCDDENLQLLCGPCNRRKGSQDYGWRLDLAREASHE